MWSLEELVAPEGNLVCDTLRALMSATSETRLMQAYQARRENRLADARQIFVETVDLCRVSGGVALAKALTGLGQIERDVEHRDVARQCYEEALAIYRVEGNALKVAHTVRHLGDIHQEDGRLDLAEPCYHEALDLYRADQRTSPLDLANAIRSFAILKEEIGNPEGAKRLWEEARNLYVAVNIEEGVAESSDRLSRLTQEGSETK
jgi:tetratricopeptide (TPR) repeat protein